MKRYKLLIVAVGLLLMLVSAGVAAGGKKAPPSKTQVADIDQLLQAAKSAIAIRTGETIERYVISAGGTAASSETYTVNGTVGQTAIGAASSETYNVSHGYWQQTSGGGGCCIGITGNVDNDGSDAIDISDLVYLVDYMFNGGPAPFCFEEADMDISGGIDISDLVYLVDYMFVGGSAPKDCP